MDLIQNFQPPDGTRLIWHSVKAKDLWEPRIQRIAIGQSEREREMVRLGWRKLCLQPISKGFEYEKLANWAHNHGLFIMPVRAVGMFQGFAHRYVGGEDMYVTAIASKPEYAEDPNPEKYLGYPECCQRFFGENFPKFIDPMWQWAGEGLGRSTMVLSSPYSNPLLRYWSLRFSPHIPCAPNCAGSIELGRQFGELMGPEERGWLEELLSGEIRWSCLHGVAEAWTENFRIVCGSNPATKRHDVICNPKEN